jgi:Asp-tRNA(Asn)/Glu-tRNA(Gln) amidotransferase A subunit family amidase
LTVWNTSFIDDGVCRFSFLANLLGLPAVSLPAGYDSAQLPIGLQVLTSCM